LKTAGRRAGRGAWIIAALTAGLAASAGAEATNEPVLFVGDGGWAVVADAPEGAKPPPDAWVREGGLWIGRLSDGAETLDWAGPALAVAAARPLPLAPAVLPPMRNAFGPCVLRSLSVRFDAQIRAHRWSLVFAREGSKPAFAPLDPAEGPATAWRLQLEDAETETRWELEPDRMGREGGMFARSKGRSRLYAGFADDETIEWHAVAAPAPNGRWILQVRLRQFRDPPRLLRLRVLVETAAPGRAVIQPEQPPAVAAVQDGAARALWVDMAEPRRFRAVTNEPGWMGLEFDLALTRATGNFPRSATVSTEVDAWASKGPEALDREAAERLSRFGGGTPVPAEILDGGIDGLAVFEPTRMEWRHPGGFRDREDALHHLMMRMSGLFADADWASSAFLCAAQGPDGGPRIELEGDAARVPVNPDPDLNTMLEMGQNRGLTLLARVLAAGGPAVWIRASGTPAGPDRHARALNLCDYPAVWDEADDSIDSIAVDLDHAEVELITSLACKLKDRGTALLVADDGFMAPFTTAHADGLVCESADPDEMRRQRTLAGPRPVVWRVENPPPEAVRLAWELGFAVPEPFKED